LAAAAAGEARERLTARARVRMSVAEVLICMYMVDGGDFKPRVDSGLQWLAKRINTRKIL
jgi:hypothetical protein